MNHLHKRTEKRFQHLIGKRVQVIDQFGKKQVGILDFAGVNDKLHGQFQVTLSRCPIWPINPSTLKLFINKIG
jgi:hypothetical protein